MDSTATFSRFIASPPFVHPGVVVPLDRVSPEDPLEMVAVSPSIIDSSSTGTKAFELWDAVEAMELSWEYSRTTGAPLTVKRTFIEDRLAAIFLLNVPDSTGLIEKPMSAPAGVRKMLYCRRSQLNSSSLGKQDKHGRRRSCPRHIICVGRRGGQQTTIARSNSDLQVHDTILHIFQYFIIRS